MDPASVLVVQQFMQDTASKLCRRQSQLEWLVCLQVTEHRLPKGFDYHKTPAPFIQASMLTLLICHFSQDTGQCMHCHAADQGDRP